MRRPGAVVLVLVLAGLAVYVFWPQAEPAAVIPGLRWPEAPGRIHLVVGGLEQTVEQGRVRLAGIERPLDQTKLSNLRFAVIGVRPSEILPVPPEAERAAWGLDGSRRLEVGELHLEWGVRRGTTFVHDRAGQRLLACPGEQTGARLDAAGGRLDRDELLPVDGITAIELGDAVHAYEDGRGWRCRGRPERPRFDGRVLTLLNTVRSVRCVNLGVGTDQIVASRRLGLVFADGRRQSLCVHAGPEVEHPKVFLSGEASQPITRRAADALLAAIAAFEVDRLYDVANPVADRLFDRAVARRDDVELLRLDGEPLVDPESPRSPWLLTWPQGCEAAADDAGERLIQALAAQVVTGCEAVAPAEQPPAGGLTWHLEGRFLPDRRTWIRIAGDRVEMPGLRARLVDPPPLITGPLPTHLLDTRLLRVEAQRVSAIQRETIAEDGVRAEILRRGDGAWSLVMGGERDGGRLEAVPAAVDATAADAVLRHLLTARSQVVRPSGRLEAVRPAVRRLRVRIEPAPCAGADDRLRLEDTVRREWVLDLCRDGEAWMGVDEETGLVHTLDAATVAGWFAPLDRRLVMVLEPAQVMGVRVVPPAPGTAWSLQREGDRWFVEDDAGTAQETDPRVVRRLLVRLAALEAVDRPAGRPALSGAESVGGRIELRVPGTGLYATTVVLRLGAARDGRVEVSVDDPRPGGLAPRGRQVVDGAALVGLLDRPADPPPTGR